MNDPTNDFRAEEPPPCEACGGKAHGSVNVERACLLAHLRTARSMLDPGMPSTCLGCGQVHRSVDGKIVCLEKHLSEARWRARHGVSRKEFEENQKESRRFAETRGALKK
jgi:hypothetical protein